MPPPSSSSSVYIWVTKFFGGITATIDILESETAESDTEKIETNVIDSYELLSDPEDQELFYDYLIANLKMYFNKFEEELSPEVPEPTNKAYDMAQQDKDDQTQEPGEMSAPDDAIELDI